MANPTTIKNLCCRHCLRALMILAPLSCFAEKVSELHLESTILGEKEQPTVSYFVPWKNAKGSNRLYWTMEKKHDESLQMIEQKALRRSKLVYQE